MLTIIVMPVLNEEASLELTCRSLGFGPDGAEQDALLVLVDNGSTDATPAVAERVKMTSRPGRVAIIHESNRGHVPARVTGARAAAEQAARFGHSVEATLLIQADADTVYEPGYIGAMTATASRMGRGFLYEGASLAPSPSLDPCRNFRKLEAAVDADFPMISDQLDVVVDDKVAAFVLADYEEWGGHRREFDTSSLRDEWLAETTRLFLRARLGFGARRVRVEGAEATTSSRRIIDDPATAFATAGFPRGPGWYGRWRKVYGGARSLSFFAIGREADIEEAISMRRRYLSALFRFLPETLSGAERLRDFATSTGQLLEPGRMLRIAFDRAGTDDAQAAGD